MADIHVGSKNRGGKMIVEATQMLANCYSTDQLNNAPRTQKGDIRKYSYYNHPCSKWTRKSLANFDWLLKHSQEMVQEKIYRGGNLHFCKTFLDWCMENQPNIPDDGWTDPAQAMAPQYIDVDPVKAYRNYYYYNKNKMIELIWTRREKPDWWLAKENK